MLPRLLDGRLDQVEDGLVVGVGRALVYRPLAATLAGGRDSITQAGFVLDYLEARCADTLAPVSSAQDGPLRLLVAARLGRTRLIDNVPA